MFSDGYGQDRELRIPDGGIHFSLLYSVQNVSEAHKWVPGYLSSENKMSGA
jgi:hypothetical protein